MMWSLGEASGQESANTRYFAGSPFAILRTSAGELTMLSLANSSNKRICFSRPSFINSSKGKFEV